MSGETARTLSVVVPVFDEATNIAPLVERLVKATRPLEVPFELVLVDDGSRDETLSVARAMCVDVPELVVVALRCNFGQTLALQAGLDCARGDIIVTMDGDLQNDPADIPRLLAEIDAGADVVSGWRKERKDTLVLRKIPSWIANRLIRYVTGVPVHDQGCALKAYRAEVIRRIDLYADMHRFIAIYTMPLGASLHEVVVSHHPRVAGQSKYGISRVFKVLADLLSLQMLINFRDKPLRWFSMLGVPFFLAAVVSCVLGLHRPQSAVMFSLVVVFGSIFASCMLAGLVGEAIVASYGTDRTEYLGVSHEWN